MSTRTHHARMARRGFSLIEAVVIIVVLAIAVPATVTMMTAAGNRQADAVQITRATTLATLVMENVLADAASKSAGLGFAGFANANAYLNTAPTGLRNRISGVTAAYAAAGLTYDVTIGPLTNGSGVTTGVAAADIFRTVTVTVSFQAADGTAIQYAVSARVTTL